MRHDKLQKELRLLLTLTENTKLSVAEICEIEGLSRRNFYYYLDFFRDSGLFVLKQGQAYSIDRSSPFFRQLFETINFTEDEALTILNLLDALDGQNVLAERIRHKLDRFYDLNILAHPDVRLHAAHMVSTVYEAIKQQRLIKISNYSSPHSQTSADRVVEPFLLMNNNLEVRAYELSSGKNKTFKVSRMGDVQLLALNWSHEQEHKQVFFDLFMFSGEEQYPISLRLDRLAYNLMIEEYPRAATYIGPCQDGWWPMQVKVASYLGIGRFVLGLYEHVQVLGDEGFCRYLRQRLSLMEDKKIK